MNRLEMSDWRLRRLLRSLQSAILNPLSNMPEWKEEIGRRLTSLGLEPAREAEIIEELSQHLEDRYAESLARGATPEEASRASLAELSGRELLQQELRRVESL